MQGESVAARRVGRQFVLILATAHVFAAGLVVFFVAAVGDLLHPYLPAALIIGLLAVAGAIWDLRAIRTRRFSLGPSRQTPKVLIQRGRDWWVTPVLWGMDTGLIGTTYRVSFVSWLLLVLALVGYAPPWAGFVYGLAFSVPLIAGVTIRNLGINNPSSPRPRVMSPRLVQVVGVVSMISLCLWTLWAAVG